MSEKSGAMLSQNDSGMNLGLIDLNLLIVFDALMHERNLTRAGRRIGLSQPAASHALGKLRQMLHDDLFIRTPEGMRPTSHAEEMAEPVGDALRMLSIALKAGSFDPANSARGFTVEVNHYASRAVVPALTRNVSNEGVLGRQITRHRKCLGPAGCRGGTDVALTTLVDGGERFKCVHLMDDDYVALLDKAHSAAGEADLSVEQVAEIPHIVIGSSSDDANTFVD
jgi:DNA-binding transcriptional LysR family regulator